MNNSTQGQRIWIGIGVLAMIIVVGVVAFRLLESEKKNTDENVGQPNKPWEVSLANEEMKASAGLIEKSFIYAIKNEYRSTVYKRDIQSGTQTKILEFDESKKADKSGNLWSGLPPAIALSPNKKSLAFIDKEGLKVFDTQTQTSKTFIRKTEEGSSETDVPPKWSESSLIGVYNLARPLWSADGKYISFLQSHYEGASLGSIDVESGTYRILQDLSGGYNNLAWSPVGHSYVKASSGGYDGIGLYVSQTDIAQADNITAKLGKTEDTPFLEANFSPDGKRIVFIFEEPGGTKHVAIANNDGTNFTDLGKRSDVQTPLFSAEGNSVFFFQKKNDAYVLVRSDLAGENFSDVMILPAEFNRWENAYWTEDGFLALVGVSSISGLTMGGDRTRMLILDLTNNKVIYASSIFEQFTTFAGLSN